jgi:hypothetical protein
MTRRSFLLVGVLLGWCSLSPGAAAHEGKGTLVLEQSQVAADSQVRYVVRLTWDNDGHAARDATLTATLVAADGTSQTPAPLLPADEDGRYAVTLSFPSPGTWTVRFTAVKPQATLEEAVTITAPTTTSTSPPTTTASTEPPANDGSENGPSAADSGSSDGGTALIVGIAALGIIGGTVVWVLRRRARSPGRLG